MAIQETYFQPGHFVTVMGIDGFSRRRSYTLEVKKRNIWAWLCHQLVGLTPQDAQMSMVYVTKDSIQALQENDEALAPEQFAAACVYNLTYTYTAEKISGPIQHENPTVVLHALQKPSLQNDCVQIQPAELLRLEQFGLVWPQGVDGQTVLRREAIEAFWDAFILENKQASLCCVTNCTSEELAFLHEFERRRQ